MKASMIALVAPAIALFGAGSGSATAADSKMVTPADFEWVEMPTLPKGAEIALVEDPRNE